MSWQIIEQSKTGKIQCSIGEYSDPLANNTSTTALDVAGSKVCVSFTNTLGTNLSGIKLIGSLDPDILNFQGFEIVSKTPVSGVNEIRCSIPVKYIKLRNTSGGNFSNIKIMLET